MKAVMDTFDFLYDEDCYTEEEEKDEVLIGYSVTGKEILLGEGYYVKCERKNGKLVETSVMIREDETDETEPIELFLFGREFTEDESERYWNKTRMNMKLVSLASEIGVNIDWCDLTFGAYSFADLPDDVIRNNNALMSECPFIHF